MKKILLLIILSILTTGCYAWNMGLYRECSYNDEDGLYYNYWEKYLEKMPCKALNKNKKL